MPAPPPPTAAASAPPRDPRWQHAIAEHASAVADLAAAARRVDPAAWARPMRDGAWTPAQVVQHVALTLEAFAQDLAGVARIRPRVGAGWQRLFRWVVLPHILFHRSLPVRAVAPREARPDAEPGDVETVLARLDAGWQRMEAEAVRVADGGARVRVMHPYFGPIPALRALRFSAVHVEHHRRQIER